MQIKKTNFETLFPDPAEVLGALHIAAAFALQCPSGHPLPRRQTWGRCTPNDCCGDGDYVVDPNMDLGGMDEEMAIKPIGLEEQVLRVDAENAADAERLQAQAKEASALMRTIGINAAREALHPMPVIPPAPDLLKLGPQEWLRQRVEQVAPYAFEKTVMEMMYGSAVTSREAAETILDRSRMLPKGKDGIQAQVTPVIVMNVIGGNQQLPYEQQRSLKRVDPTRQVASIDELKGNE